MVRPPTGAHWCAVPSVLYTVPVLSLVVSGRGSGRVVVGLSVCDDYDSFGTVVV